MRWRATKVVKVVVCARTRILLSLKALFRSHLPEPGKANFFKNNFSQGNSRDAFKAAYPKGKRTIKIFMGEEVVDGEGGNSERCLKWGGGGEGSLRNL